MDEVGSQTADQEAIIRAALAEVADPDHSYSRPVCVSSVIDDDQTDRFSYVVKDFARPHGGDDNAEPLMEVSSWWRGMSDRDDLPVLHQTSTRLEAELQDATRDVYSRPKPEKPVQIRIPADLTDGIEAEVLDPSEARDANCRTLINYSVPEISGDFAFMIEEMRCGSLCGTAAALAFQRVNGKWRYLTRSMYSMS